MLRITIELVPRGIEEKARVIARGIIYNAATGSRLRGNYQAIFGGSTKRGGSTYANVTGFKRRSRGPWILLREALKNAFEGVTA